MTINLSLIKSKRLENNFNIDDMAKKLGLTNGSMYWKRENGDYKFKAEELMKLSIILNVPLESLFLSRGYSKTEIDKKNEKAI